MARRKREAAPRKRSGTKPTRAAKRGGRKGRTQSKRYQSIANDVRKDAQEQAAASGLDWLKVPEGVELFKPKKGKNLFDIIPYEITTDDHPIAAKGRFWYVRDVYVHYGVGADDKAYTCLRRTFKQPCPICEEGDRLAKDVDADDDEIKDLRPKRRQIFNVYHDKEFKIFTTSFYNFGNLLGEEISDEDEDFHCFADVPGGYTLQVRFKEKKFGRNKFLEADRIDFKRRRKDFDDNVFDEIQNLDKLIICADYDDLYAAFFEENVGEDESKSDRGAPKRSSSTKKVGGRRRKKEECPVEEGVFGDDFDTYDDCDECELREPCADKYDEDPDDGYDDDPDDDPDDGYDDDPDDGYDDDPDVDPDDDPDDDYDDDPVGEDECPYGHEFGVDVNTTDDCDDCEVWDACQAAEDEREKETQKKSRPTRRRKKKEAEPKPKQRPSRRRSPKTKAKEKPTRRRRRK